jgi:lipid A 3-O-deacylase
MTIPNNLDVRVHLLRHVLNSASLSRMVMGNGFLIVGLGAGFLAGNIYGDEPVSSAASIVANSLFLDSQQSQGAPAPERKYSLWDTEPGEGLRKGVHHTGFALGAGLGTETFGTRHKHDLALATADLGWVFTDVLGNGHWYKGNWELRGEFFAGSEFKPDVAYVLGAAPFLRYDFATGTHIVPFFELGAGAGATGIPQDLSTTFEFNVQAGFGLEWFFTDHIAASAQYRWIHISNAKIKHPDNGVNTSILFLGLEWFY